MATSPAVLTGQRARLRVPLVDLDFCRRHQLRCVAPSPDAAEAAQGPPFALPAPAEMATYDFYCRRQSAGEAGFSELATAGEELRQSKGWVLSMADEAPPEDHPGIYVRREPPPDTPVETREL